MESKEDTVWGRDPSDTMSLKCSPSFRCVGNDTHKGTAMPLKIPHKCGLVRAHLGGPALSKLPV